MWGRLDALLGCRPLRSHGRGLVCACQAAVATSTPAAATVCARAVPQPPFLALPSPTPPATTATATSTILSSTHPRTASIGSCGSPFPAAALPSLSRGFASSAAAAAPAEAPPAGYELPQEISDEEWAEIVQALRDMAASKSKPLEKGGWRDAFKHLPVHLARAGLTPERLSALNFVHVAGTKGKGSTCAMVESILRTCGYRTGLYTSPHLVDVRERVRVNGQMLSRAEFAASFRRVYGAVREASERDAASGGVGMPSFFAFVTMLAMDAFLARPPAMRPHAVVLEVGIGGRLDATNGVVTPGSLAAAGIASLGFDHMELLGDTLPRIAREKAGIMKPGRPILTVPQPPDAMAALREVANHVGARLSVPPPLSSYQLPTHAGADPSEALVGLGGEHMKVNAALAVALAAEFEQQYAAAAAAAAGEAGAVAPAAPGRPLTLAPGGPEAAAAAVRAAAVRAGRLPPQYAAGLKAVRWPGRSQVLQQGSLRLFLDGAHTPESMATAAAWFGAELRRQAGQSGRVAPVVLLFNCMRDRDPAALLPALAEALAEAGVGAGAAGKDNVPLASVAFTPMLSGGGVLLPPTANGQPSTAAAQPPKQQPPTDLAWQERMRELWVDGLAAAAAPTSPEGSLSGSGSGSAPTLPRVWVAESLPAALASLQSSAAAEAKAAESVDGEGLQGPVGLNVLVTGSLYLVGDVLRLFDSAPA
ncbi:hypothetical protein HYH03_013067 [Edaphochlamys debaryana]|uniref:tetrahydrofolate synthase n=1 Tax=Edaphochlamys debaryana TaxID=47281 RepID=A0A835XSV4_9CHLO|nr:hypothetical protein HYH03_013067 [Edaphochlamys debaryana]|eukprot:KAG2488378.1 hypothetical protein HYH03_013067 [Edaphochlamys debaryana]